MEKVQIWQAPLALRLVTSCRNFRSRYGRWHHHPFYEFGLVLGGRCTWHVGSRRRRSLRSGDAILLKPGVPHWEEVEPAAEARLAWLGFDFGGPPPSWCHRVVALAEDSAEITAYFEVIAREHQLTDARARARVNLALQSLLLLLERRAEGSPEPVAVGSGLNPRQAQTVESAAHYFRQNLQNPLSIAQVAAYHSLCPTHFSSLFHRHHRITPRGFLRQARLQRAADLLTETELGLKEIAAQCGFVDAAHLCKAFRQEHRITPSLFRARMRRTAALTA